VTPDFPEARLRLDLRIDLTATPRIGSSATLWARFVVAVSEIFLHGFFSVSIWIYADIGRKT
jgi:hypothetical protein